MSRHRLLITVFSRVVASTGFTVLAEDPTLPRPCLVNEARVRRMGRPLVSAEVGRNETNTNN